MLPLELEQPGLDHRGGPVLLAHAYVLARGAHGLDHQLHDVVHYPGVSDAQLADTVRFEVFSNNLAPNSFIFVSLRRSGGRN